MKQGFLPVAERADADILARQPDVEIQQVAPPKLDDAELARRQAEIAEKYRLIEEQRAAQQAAIDAAKPVDPAMQGFRLRSKP
jgi:hypothetical protein